MMKLIFSMLVLLSTSVLSAQNKLTITISGIEEEKGQLQVCLYDKAEAYMKTGQAVSCKWLPATSSLETHVFEPLSAGRYAVIIIHDLNGNGSLDTNLFRIPKEPYGFSNNPSTTFGPPDFDGASFGVSEDTEIEVRLK